MPTLRLRPVAGGEPVTVTLDRADRRPDASHLAAVDGRAQAVELELLATGAGYLRLGTAVHPFFCHREGGRVQVWLDGRVHVLEKVDDGPRRASAEAGAARSGSLTAPMPGAVLKILATPGASFAAHEPLVIMESMKMELTLSAPHAGRVRKVNCEAGELVELGAVLVELEDEDDAAS
ncbi:MAG: biotin/lipoyl-containing protein [Candidatus Krumholzibacteriia bacterium]